MDLTRTALLFETLLAAVTLAMALDGSGNHQCNTAHTDAVGAPRLAQRWKRGNMHSSVHLVTFDLG